MGFLSRLLSYPRVCIQCHNNPDADTIASAFGVYCYLRHHGVEACIVYGGPQPTRKSGLKLMMKKCAIPVTYTHTPPPADLLLLVDCQYGEGNVERFDAEKIAVLDHHIPVAEPYPDHLIRPDLQSCSTLIWLLLKQEAFPLHDHPQLAVALLYGLYTDTACFADLYHRIDNEMRLELFEDQVLFDQLAKSSMTVAELMVVSDAMQNHYFDIHRRFAIVAALSCDQSVLGVIGDMMIHVDVIQLSFTYTRSGGGYRISLRTCHELLPADQIVTCVCRGIGSGGGHARKAGGYIQDDKLKQLYGDLPIFEVINRLLCRYFDEHQISGSTLF